MLLPGTASLLSAHCQTHRVGTVKVFLVVLIRAITWTLARLPRYIAHKTVASMSRIKTRLVLSRTANTSGS